MAEEGKKISFGFAKSIKKTVLKNTAPQEEKKVDYIECLDGKNIKVIGGEEKKDEPLIIPLLGSGTWKDRIAKKIDADIFESKTDKKKAEDANDVKEKSKFSNGSTSPKASIEESKSTENNAKISLEEQAAKEIIEELKKEGEDTQKPDLTLPLAEDESLRGKEQSTLEDYEKIPIDSFGIAMLRGMGWKPGKGIGKSEKIVAAVIPELRPRGMGLGADKVALQKKTTSSKNPEEELKIEKGSFVKITAGKRCNNYGQIEGLDDDTGRLIIKLALGGNIISVNEFMVQPVTKSEYEKNSKVINAKKYDEYKNKEVKESTHKHRSKRRLASSEQSQSSEDDKSSIDEKKKSNTCDKNKHNRTDDQKSKRRKKHSESDSNSDNDHIKRKRRERSGSSSSNSYKSKKSKKSRKHKKYDCSPERSSRKHKKKDKEREKREDRKSREHKDRRKHKKHERSRSQS